MIKDISAKAGIEKKIPHIVFVMAKLIEFWSLAENLKDVQAILGHCDPASSFTYLQWNDKEFAMRAKMFL